MSSTTPFLPSTLPLIPLPPPQVLYPHLRVTLPLRPSHLAVVLSSIAENAQNQKIEDGARLVGVVPVVESERRIGRWACATAQPSTPSKSQTPEDLQPLETLRDRRAAELSRPARTAIDRELARLTKIPPQSAEYGVAKTYVEWLLALPWKRVTTLDTEVDLEQARKRLEEDHEGLEKVKRRVVEYLAVYRLKKQLYLEQLQKCKQISLPTSKGDGRAALDPSTADDLLELIPPTSERRRSKREMPLQWRARVLQTASFGTRDRSSSSSIARSLAASMGRKFHRISLGGVRDEAEIRGHRRTYVGALPGLLVQGLRKVGVSNPLILLDELDKVGTSNFHGDPSAALLETLDPAQNWTFHDHYLGDVPLDLSQVTFVATANTTDTISPPLLDRCEVIECSGYVMDEKVRIATRFLVPKQVKENGLTMDMVRIGEEAVLKVVTDYTREAGVRSLEREIGKLCRTKAVEYSSARDKGQLSDYNPEISVADVERILGVARFDQEVREEVHRPGVMTGLAYRGSGTGGILLIETTLVPGGKGRLVLTGSLGDVIKESAELGLTWVKAHAVQLGIVSHSHEDPLKDVDLHLHLPSGAVRKDGPSAGVGMVLAMVSLLTGRTVPSTLAVTGEVTLRGAVTAVGGIKEKVLGAHRAGITKVILPKRNFKDVQADLPQSMRTQMSFAYVGTIEEALEEVWGRDVWAVKGGARVEARL
ncbi:hypothetical protein EHS25_007477 [Saitozyma podzolica]|uniref:Lon proteolytic domain-containing protein n=1 Tax=Saitozyma podzolica TaxID=1890683 RepID=A0A427YPT3_9TREE|nr:hypothetical protein EHS25_007477 [Saitozyma podzolica]